MSEKAILICKSIGMLFVYWVIMTASIYWLSGWTLDTGKTVTWTIFMVFGIIQCYRWFRSKINDLNDKEE